MAMYIDNETGHMGCLLQLNQQHRFILKHIIMETSMMDPDVSHIINLTKILNSKVPYYVS